jgi:competence protein ComEC
MESPKLFLNAKEFWITISILSAIVLIRLAFEYQEYQEFVSKPFYYTEATLLQEQTKTKDHKRYKILKLKDRDGRVFYTATYSKENFVGKLLRVKIVPTEDISFGDYLGAFYAKSRVKILGDTPTTIKDLFIDSVASQHSDSRVNSFYQAIFFATPLDRTLRDDISALGVSHLVALSGFHLSILWGVIYGILAILYRPLQQRYFPYRMMLLDMGIVTLIALGYYLCFVDSPPSLMRSYTMLFVAWVLLLLGIELVSFELLGSVAVLLLALFPYLIVSFGFYLSIVGVFYIYLVIRYGGSDKWLISLLYIPIGIFILMLPILHSIFGLVSMWQLLSPILSLGFILFYPSVILLHIVGYGDLFDDLLIYLFSLPLSPKESLLPIWALSIYLLLSIGSIWSRWLFGLTFLSALTYGGYIFLWI